MSSVGTPNQLHARVSAVGSNKNAYPTNHQNGIVVSSSTARAATTTATTTMNNNNNTLSLSLKKSTVDDAKYDRRMKQRLLLHTQRQRRRQKMIFDCRQLCLRIILLVTIVLAILYYIISYIFLFTTISSSSSSTSSSLLLSNPASLLLQRRSYHHHPPTTHQHVIEPPHILPSTAPLDLQYQQLRLFFLSSTTLTNNNHQHNFKNNNDLLSEEQQQGDQSSPQMILRKKQLIDVLESWLEQEDYEIQNNLGSIHPRYTRPYLLPPINTNQDDNSIDRVERRTKKLRKNNNLPYMKATQLGNFFRVYRLALPISNPTNQHIKSDTKTNAFLKFRKKWKKERRNTKGDDNTNMNDNENDDNTKKESPPRTKKNTKNPMKWQDEYDALIQQYGSRDNLPGPIVDYTNPTLYEYPTKPTKSQHQLSPPMDGSYPKLQSLQEILQKWPQNEDYNIDQYTTIQETLQHFDYQNPNELQMAKQYRDAELPFKLYNIPDIIAATPKWQDDDYVGQMFGSVNSATSNWLGERSAGTARYPQPDGTIVHIPTARGTAQESRNHYFAFYVAKQWDVETMGLTPTRNIQDWNYTIWSQHAIYADAVRLTHDKPHFYWQSGVSPEERHESSKHWTFITRDLPMFSTTKDNFFVFHVDEQKGIQCRFGERGVVAATHFDSGRNMVAMINGAKRYILSPPNQCSKLGIFKNKRSPIYRHSLLNFGHIQFLQDDDHDSTTKEKTTTTTTNTSTIPKMSPEEREWLQRAASSQAVETVLKQGEVLYIPSHWFHYIVSLQKSAQCNVRSGIDVDGTHIFGGRNDVDQCTD